MYDCLPENSALLTTWSKNNLSSELQSFSTVFEHLTQSLLSFHTDWVVQFHSWYRTPSAILTHWSAMVSNHLAFAFRTSSHFPKFASWIGVSVTVLGYYPTIIQSGLSIQYHRPLFNAGLKHSSPTQHGRVDTIQSCYKVCAVGNTYMTRASALHSMLS